MTDTNKDLITALYCRLSVEDRRKGESMSIENQRLMLSEFAVKNKLGRIKLYVDDGYSGTDNTRPAYVEMMNDVYAGKVGTVIVKDQSRLGRDHLETDRLLEIVFPSYNIRFIAITDGVDSVDDINDMLTLRNLFNDFYARDTSRKIRAVQRAKGERGERIGSHIPYGYMRDPDDRKRIIPNPETAPIVKRIFKMYGDGIGFVKICDVLSKEKVLSPGMYEFQKIGSRSGNPDLDRPYHWAQATVRKMLLNQVYCGDTVNFKTYTKSNKLRKKLKNTPDKILVFKDTHEAIIDRETFDLVQKHFEGRKRPDKHGEIDKLAGYLYCADCGARMYLRRGKIYNYSCSGHSKRTTDCSSAHYIRAAVVEEAVLAELKRVIEFANERSDEFYNYAMQTIGDEPEKMINDIEHQLNKRIKRLDELDMVFAAMYEDRVVDRLNSEQYDMLSSKLWQEQTVIKAEIEELKTRFESFKNQKMSIKSFIDNAKNIADIQQLTPELLRTFIKRIEVHEKEERHSRKGFNDMEIFFAYNEIHHVRCNSHCIE